MKSDEPRVGSPIPATERRDLELSPRAGQASRGAVAESLGQAPAYHRKPQRRELSYPLAALAYTWAAVMRRGR